VPHLVQGRNAFINNRAIAVGTPRGKQMMVVLLTVGLSVTLVEVACAKRLPTVGTHKVLHMPCTAQGSDHLSNNRLATGSTNSLLLEVDSLLVEVRL